MKNALYFMRKPFLVLDLFLFLRSCFLLFSNVGLFRISWRRLLKIDLKADGVIMRLNRNLKTQLVWRGSSWIYWSLNFVSKIAKKCLSFFYFLKPDMSPWRYRNWCFLVALCNMIVRRQKLEIATKRVLH